MKKCFIGLFILCLLAQLNLLYARSKRESSEALSITKTITDSVDEMLASNNVIKVFSDIIIEEGRTVNKAVAIKGNIIVMGTVRKDVVSIGGKVMLDPGAVVGKNVISLYGTVEKSRKADVRGNILEVNLPFIFRNTGVKFWGVYCGIQTLISILLLVLALFFTVLFPKPIQDISTTIEINLRKVIFWGVLGILLIVPVAVVLTISVIGIVLVPVEIAFTVCMFFIGYVSVLRILGSRVIIALRKPQQTLILEVLCGFIVMIIIGLIPVVSEIVKAIVLFLGFGGVLLNIIAHTLFGR